MTLAVLYCFSVPQFPLFMKWLIMCLKKCWVSSFPFAVLGVDSLSTMHIQIYLMLFWWRLQIRTQFLSLLNEMGVYSKDRIYQKANIVTLVLQIFCLSLNIVDEGLIHDHQWLWRYFHDNCQSFSGCYETLTRMDDREAWYVVPPVLNSSELIKTVLTFKEYTYCLRLGFHFNSFHSIAANMS